MSEKSSSPEARVREVRRKPDAVPAPLPGREPLPRITRLMALAILFDELLRTGQVASMAELARICRVSRARVSQVMDLLNLAPEAQKALLAQGADTTERETRPAACRPLWVEQGIGYRKISPVETST